MESNPIRPFRLRIAVTMAAVVLAVIWGTMDRNAWAQDKPQRVVVRFNADFPPPPHPAALAMKYFSERLPQVLPGSQARVYYAGALYTIPETFEALRAGNLEMSWMQVGKAAPVDPWMMAIVGPGVLTTVGAVENIEELQTYQMLVDRLETIQGIKVFGSAHMSFGMGAGGRKRFLKSTDFAGHKLRTMTPIENASFEAWKASPVVMAMGDVPSALQSGVIDGLMTSIGGWISVREQAPFYTMGGAGAFVGDYYMVSSSRRWWEKLNPATQQVLEDLIKETIKVQKELNWCVDKMTYEKYGTKDPSKPGVYWMTPEEVSALTEAAGEAPANFVKSKTPKAVDRWVDLFIKEGRELSKKHPPGSCWIETVDCSKYADRIIIR